MNKPAEPTNLALEDPRKGWQDPGVSCCMLPGGTVAGPAPITALTPQVPPGQHVVPAAAGFAGVVAAVVAAASVAVAAVVAAVAAAAARSGRAHPSAEAGVTAAAAG